MAKKTVSTAQRPASLARRRLPAFTLAILLAATPAFAITAGDFLDRMNSDERTAYLPGAIEMAMYAASADEKSNAKASCIERWYYGGEGQAQRTIIATFERYKDQPAVGLLRVLINRACPGR
jgi:hypothetical protein